MSEDPLSQAAGGMVESLNDLDPMPFGKHKGEPMQDVPASYLHWLWTKCGYKQKRSDPVANYIRKSLQALREEHPDGLWS